MNPNGIKRFTPVERVPNLRGCTSLRPSDELPSQARRYNTTERNHHDHHHDRKARDERGQHPRAPRHRQRGRRPARARRVPVPRPLAVDRRHPQPNHRRRLLRRGGASMRHEMPFVADADHPAALVGADQGPTPVEFLLQGLAACLTAGIGNIAAVRGVAADRGREAWWRATSTCSACSASMPTVRNGYSAIRVSFPDPRRRARGEAARHRRAEPRPLGRLRRADQRRPGLDRGRRRLTSPARRAPGIAPRAPGPPPQGPPCDPTPPMMPSSSAPAAPARPPRCSPAPAPASSLIERDAPGTDTLSTYALMRGAVMQLQALGPR